MLSKYIRMDIALADIITFGQPRTQPCRIQNRTGTEDMVLRQSGNLMKCIRQNVHRIADNNICSVRSVLGNLRNNALGDINIGLRQLQTGLTRLSRNTGGKDYNIGSCCIGVIARVNRTWSAKGQALTDVQRFSQRLLSIDVDHYDL